MGPHLLTPALILFSTTIACGQTQFWSDTFEDAGAPSSGTRTPSVENYANSGAPMTLPASRYFFRTNQANILTQNGSYTNVQGSKFWAAEDIDAALTGSTNGQSSHQTITWSGINIGGKIGLSFRGMFACNQVGGNVWDGSGFPYADYMIVEYRIDGGAWTNALRFFTTAAGGGNLAQETTGDSLAFGEGPAITNMTFTEFTANISGTGTTLDLRFKCSSNGATTEEVAIDNFRLFNTTSLPVELTAFSSECRDQQEAVLWTSESEKDFDKYTLQRSADGELFEPVADIQPKGAPDKPASYEVLLPGTESTVYYRLKMTDLNGTFRYSGIIASENCLEERKLLQSFVVEEDRLTCFFSAPHMRYALLSVSGTAIIPDRGAGNDTKQMIPLSVRPGVYLLHVTNGTRRETYRIFVP